MYLFFRQSKQISSFALFYYFVFSNLFFLPTSEIRDIVYMVIGTRQTFPNTKYGGFIRQASQIGQTFIPLCDKII